MVLYFDTPDGPLQVSQVLRLDYLGNIEWLKQMSHIVVGRHGEAAVAELGEGRFLFVLLSQKVEDLLHNTMNDARKPGQRLGYKRSLKFI